MRGRRNIYLHVVGLIGEGCWPFGRGATGPPCRPRAPLYVMELGLASRVSWSTWKKIEIDRQRPAGRVSPRRQALLRILPYLTATPASPLQTLCKPSASLKIGTDLQRPADVSPGRPQHLGWANVEEAGLVSSVPFHVGGGARSVWLLVVVPCLLSLDLMDNPNNYSTRYIRVHILVGPFFS